MKIFRPRSLDHDFVMGRICYSLSSRHEKEAFKHPSFLALYITLQSHPCTAIDLNMIHLADRSVLVDVQRSRARERTVEKRLARHSGQKLGGLGASAIVQLRICSSSSPGTLHPSFHAVTCSDLPRGLAKETRDLHFFVNPRARVCVHVVSCSAWDPC